MDAYNQRFSYIELIKFRYSLWKKEPQSTRTPLITPLSFKIVYTNALNHTNKLNTDNTTE